MRGAGIVLSGKWSSLQVSVSCPIFLHSAGHITVVVIVCRDYVFMCAVV